MSKYCVSSTEVGENIPFVKVSFDALNAKTRYSFQQAYTPWINESDMNRIWPLVYVIYLFWPPCDDNANRSLISWFSC